MTKRTVKQLNFPVIHGYTNAKDVCANFGEPQSACSGYPETESISSITVLWDQSVYGEQDTLPTMEQLGAKDIKCIYSAELHDVDYEGKPLDEKRLAEKIPFEYRQKCYERIGGRTQSTRLERPFIIIEHRADIRLQFPETDFPRAQILRIELWGKRSKGFDSLSIIAPDVVALNELTQFMSKTNPTNLIQKRFL